MITFDSTSYTRRERTLLYDETIWLEISGDYTWITDSLGYFQISIKERNTVLWAGLFFLNSDSLLEYEVLPEIHDSLSPPNLSSFFHYSEYYGLFEFISIEN